MTTGTHHKGGSAASDLGQRAHVLIICNTKGEFARVFSKIKKAVEKAPKVDVLLVGQFLGSKVVNAALMKALSTEGDKLPCSVNVFISQGERKLIGESVDQIGSNIFINSGKIIICSINSMIRKENRSLGTSTHHSVCLSARFISVF